MSACFYPLACSVCSWHCGHGCNVLLVHRTAITLALQEPHCRNSSHGHSAPHKHREQMDNVEPLHQTLRLIRPLPQTLWVAQIL